MPKLLTQFSSHANTIADTFRSAFVKTRLGDCTLEMSAPEESTRGGLYGLQQITLHNPSGMAIIVGSVHAGEKRAELRDYGLVSQLHAERFKQAPSFAEPDYAAFVAKATPVFSAFGLQVTVLRELPKGPVSDPPDATPSLAPTAARAQLVKFAVIVFVILLIGGVGLLWGRQVLGH